MCAAAVIDHNALPPPRPQPLAAVRRHLIKERLRGSTVENILNQLLEAKIRDVAETARQPQILLDRCQAVSNQATSWIAETVALNPTEAAEMRIPNLKSTLKKMQVVNKRLQANMQAANKELATQKRTKEELINSLSQTRQLRKMRDTFSAQSEVTAIGAQICYNNSGIKWRPK